jgi:hypothetical protein
MAVECITPLEETYDRLGLPRHILLDGPLQSVVPLIELVALVGSASKEYEDGYT